MKARHDQHNRRVRLRVSPQRRQELLDGFFASGLSAVDYSRQCGVKYLTLLSWIRQARPQRESTAGAAVTFVEAVVPDLREGFIDIEVGAVARLQVRDAAGAALAARLLHEMGRLSC